MKALIIAAGKGSRLKSLTKDEPKPLIQLLGLSLIERVILTAKQAGIDEFVIVIGYLGEKIKEKLDDGNRYGVKITYIENREWQRGNGVSVLKAKDLLNENFILLMSDHIFDNRILKELIDYDTRNSVVLAIDRRRPLLGDTKVLEKEGRIADIGKNIKESNCIDTGIFLCSPKIFSHIEEAVKEGKTELAHGIAKSAENRDAETFDITQIKPYISSMRKEIKAFWIDVDTKEDLIKARELLIENACKGRNDLLATYVNKPIENFIVSKLVNTRITPNQVTILTNIVAYTSTFLFLKGYLLFASLLTFIVSFMDGVDGKLSRVKIATSNIGKMEHAFDFLFEHSWYIALAIYLSKAYGISVILLPAFILLFDGFSHYCGQAFGKAIKGRPLADYGRIEQLFRKFDGRKNSYIIFILIGVLLNAIFWSLVAIFVWSLVSAIFYSARTIKHLHYMDYKKR
ncbi:MAG: NTP transferase domain-containing protein [Candidatus Thermoplasmatota archaeon]|nr:NTP transferase domain-containing protein [Candidatus Thermoplasmatota archaeon]MBU4256306.1 NTP transferase domain-containing protein [Candidatus Thermoplasmatota archaeon]MCG2825189.1 NTP transferase domain-containing protein [Thermoplasmatales archaeon]